jgi:hypothetical protein
MFSGFGELAKVKYVFLCSILRVATDRSNISRHGV